jgi:hypothetical protein
MAPSARPLVFAHPDHEVSGQRSSGDLDQLPCRSRIRRPARRVVTLQVRNIQVVGVDELDLPLQHCDVVHL